MSVRHAGSPEVKRLRYTLFRRIWYENQRKETTRQHVRIAFLPQSAGLLSFVRVPTFLPPKIGSASSSVQRNVI